MRTAISQLAERLTAIWSWPWRQKGPRLVFLVAVIAIPVTIATIVITGGDGSERTRVSKEVSAEDGGIVSLGGDITLRIPAGALSGDTTVTISRASEENAAPGELETATSIGHAFEIDLAGAELTRPVTLAITYDPDLLPQDMPGEAAFLAYYDEAREDWLPVHGSVDLDRHVVTVETGHLSWWIPASWRCPTRPAVGGRLTCVNVTKVDDGDTICVEWPGDPPSDPPEPGHAVEADQQVCATERMTPDLLDWPVRLIGIDTPEADPPECYADEATDKVRRTLEGRTVWLELDPAESLDRIGRILAYVWDGSEMVNEQLVLQGFARERHWFPDIGQVPTQKYAERLVAAGDEARENLRGVWGECVEVAYQCHIAFDGWLNWFWDGETCGTTGKARQMEALRIWLPANSFRIEYRAHVAVEGWQNWVRPEELAGTEDRALQMEAIQIRLVDAPPNVHVEYRAHVAELDWQEWMRDGATAGTVGKGLPVEAIQIRIVRQPSVQPIIIEPPPTPTPTPTPAPVVSVPTPEPRPCPVDDVSFCDFVYEIDAALAIRDVFFIVSRTEFRQHTCGEYPGTTGTATIPPEGCLGAPADKVIECVDWVSIGAGAHLTCLTKTDYAELLEGPLCCPETGEPLRVYGIGRGFSDHPTALFVRDLAHSLDPSIGFGVVLHAAQRNARWIISDGVQGNVLYLEAEFPWPPQ